MLLKRLLLQHFRSYSQADFKFDDNLTVIIGANTAGKTNLTEAIHFLSSGKSFRGQSDKELVQFDQEIARVQGLIEEGINDKGLMIKDKTKLEAMILTPEANNGRWGKKFLVNGVAKSRNTFVGHLPMVAFRPEELDIVIAGPSLRRQFLNDVLETVDKEYYYALIAYEKALRQRNALLDIAQETGRKSMQQFAYWDDLLITNGTIIYEKRKLFIEYLNAMQKEILELEVVYDHSIVSKERLMQYDEAEIGAGNTLVGPHRDDFFLLMEDTKNKKRDIKLFGSRGQQRLVVLQLKLLQIQFATETLGQKPLLVLDDIFSELDSSHIQLVLDKTKGAQVILTTTHKEFLPQDIKGSMIELSLENRK